MIIPVKAYQRIRHFKACDALFRFALKEMIMVQTGSFSSYILASHLSQHKKCAKSSILPHAIATQIGVLIAAFCKKNKFAVMCPFNLFAQKECRFRNCKAI